MVAAIEEKPLPEARSFEREYNMNLTPYTGSLLADDEPMLAAEMEEEQTYSGDSYDAPRLKRECGSKNARRAGRTANLCGNKSVRDRRSV